MKIRTVVFEDNDMLRKSLVTLLQNNESYFVVGEYTNVENVQKIINSKDPDLVILDIDMAGKDGIWAIPKIKEINPHIPVVMYTQFEDDEKIFRSICAGADGYILKKVSPFKLIERIKEIYNGGAPMSPSIAKKVLQSFRKVNPSAKISFNLTDRELEVLKLLVKGYSVKAISSEIDIAYETVRSHLKNIYTKLQVNCGKEAIAKVLAEKITLN